MKQWIGLIVLFIIAFVVSEPLEGLQYNTALAPLVVMGAASLATSIGSSIFGASSSYSAARKARKAQEEAERRAGIARGAQMFNEDRAMATPEYDDDPFTSNERKLYGEGDTNIAAPSSSAGTDWVGMLKSAGDISNNVMSAINTNAQNNNMVANAQFQANKVVPGGTQITNDAAADKAAQAKRFANPYSNPKTDEYADGGLSNIFSGEKFKGVNQQSSNTAVVEGGTHESGDDVKFNRPDGSTAKVEGGEGMMTMPNGAVKVYSDRIQIPGEDTTIAEKFKDLSFLKGNLEKDRIGQSNAITRNTTDRQLLGIDSTLDNLFAVQEGAKKVAQYKNKDITYPTEQLFKDGDPDITKTPASQTTDPEEFDPKKRNISKSLGNDVNSDILLTNGMTNVFSNKGLDDVSISKLAKTLKTPYTDEIANKSKSNGNNTLWNTIKSDDGLDGISTGLTLLDNIYNAKQIKDVEIKDPRYVNQVDFDTEYDTTAAEYGVKKELDNFYKNVDKNTSSSVVGLNMKLSAMTNGIDKLNQVFDTKEKYETEMKNREILTNSGIEAQNAGIYNAEKDKESLANHNNSMLKSSNFANAIDDVVNGMVRYQGHRTEKDRFAAMEMSSAATGVNMKNLEQGMYKDLAGEQIDKYISEAADKGFLSYDTYKTSIDGNNRVASAGSNRKVMTKSEFYEKYPNAAGNPSKAKDKSTKK